MFSLNILLLKILSTVLRKSFKHINLNHKDNSGSTALHLAVKRGDLDSTILFLTHGANVNETDVKGETPLMKAVAVGFFYPSIPFLG